MSQSSSGSDGSRTALGSTENFWDHDREDYAQEDESEADSDAAEVEYVDPSPGPGAFILREQWVIDHYLRRHPEAQLFCPYCWHELDAESELSDPESYVPESEIVTDPRYRLDPDDDRDDAPTAEENVELTDLDYGTRLELWTEEAYGDHRRHRHCDNCGGVSWGGVLGDLTTDQFLEVVDGYLETKEYLTDREIAEVRGDARKRKQGGMADRDNREQIAIDVATGISMEEF